jgi:hypothetical protein
VYICGKYLIGLLIYCINKCKSATYVNIILSPFSQILVKKWLKLVSVQPIFAAQAIIGWFYQEKSSSYVSRFIGKIRECV